MWMLSYFRVSTQFVHKTRSTLNIFQQPNILASFLLPNGMNLFFKREKPNWFLISSVVWCSWFRVMWRSLYVPNHKLKRQKKDRQPEYMNVAQTFEYVIWISVNVLSRSLFIFGCTISTHIIETLFKKPIYMCMLECSYACVTAFHFLFAFIHRLVIIKLVNYAVENVRIF